MEYKSEKDRENNNKSKNPKHPNRITTDPKTKMTLENIKEEIKKTRT